MQLSTDNYLLTIRLILIKTFLNARFLMLEDIKH